MGRKRNKKKRNNEFYEEKIHNKTILCIVLGVIFIICLVLCLLLEYFQVHTVYVEGNQHYTASEVKELVEKGKFGDNTLYLSMYYKNKSITNVPFVERMDVDVIDRNTIKVMVYEKSLAGYVEYLGNYLYFDKDGIIVESSKIKTVGIPLVTGLKFDYFVMYEELPVQEPDVFHNILVVTQMLNKYEITTDKIYFDESGTMTLYFGAIRVNMGDMTLLEEKIQRLDAILPKLDGEAGVLHLEGYEDNNDTFTFTRDKSESISKNDIVSGNAITE